MSKEITNVSVDILKVHPRNTEFFDDISGEEYEKFKRSIQEDGILSPILVSPDMTIISGHQRTKATKELGIKLVPVIIREDLTEENSKLKVLLAANFGRTKNDPVKQRKVAVEYINLCGLKQGDNQFSTVDNRLSLKEIASQLGTSETSLKELLLIERKLTPELKEILDSGKITKTTASKILVKLSPEEQEELISTLDVTRRYTQNQIQEYVDKLAEKDSTITALQSRKPEQIETIIDNTDYTTLKMKEEELKTLNNKYLISQEKERLLQERINLFESDSVKYKKLKCELEDMTKSKDDIGRQIDAITSISGFASKISTVLKTELSPIKYSKALLEMKSEKIVTDNLSDIVYEVQKWCDEMRIYLPETDKMNVIDMEGN